MIRQHDRHRRVYPQSTFGQAHASSLTGTYHAPSYDPTRSDGDARVECRYGAHQQPNSEYLSSRGSQRGAASARRLEWRARRPQARQSPDHPDTVR